MMADMLSGRAGTSDASETKSGCESCSSGLKRRSKPMVLLGRPHIALPHEPSKCAGNTST